VPSYLDRETLVVLDGTSRLELLEGQRWAEPLRDTLPRLLRHDLALLRGARNIWLAPAPPGVNVNRQLRVEVLSLQASRSRGRCCCRPVGGYRRPQRTPSSANG
jgi:uncharacterized lipoprotein YmbA